MVIKPNVLIKGGIIVSAFIAAAAFIFPYSCAEFVFFFLLPIFYNAYKNSSLSLKEACKQGFLWGLIFYLIFFCDIFLLITYKGNGSFRCFAFVFLLMYGAALCALWFVLAQVLTHATRKPILSWTLATVLYFIWVESAFFIIFGAWQGNCLTYLGLPLGVRPAWLYFLPALGKKFFLILLITCNSFIFLCIKTYSKSASTMLTFLIFFFLLGWIFYKQQPFPLWAQKFGFICAYTSESDYICAAEQIMHLLDSFKKKYPECTYIVMPESTFKFPLNRLKRYISLWNCPDTTLFMGAHRLKDAVLYNSLYYIVNNRIMSYYDKQFILFFAEYVPALWQYIPGSSSLFLSQGEHFSAACQKREFEIQALGVVKPLICSDCFLDNSHLTDMSTYLCVVNDSWFCLAYFPQLMYLHAKLIAIAKKSTLIYSGYHYHCIFNASGTSYNLPGLADGALKA